MDRFLLLTAILLLGAWGLSERSWLLKGSEVTIDAYPSTQRVPLGTTVVLVCRDVGVSEEDSSIRYQWSCPNGVCDDSTSSDRSEFPFARSRRIINTLIVNIVDKSDSGEYRCTVSEGGTTRNSSINMTVTDGLVMYSFTDSGLVFLPLNSFVSEEKFVSNSSYKINVLCTMGSDDIADWSWPDGTRVCKGCDDGRPIQRDGYFLTEPTNPKRTTNGPYTCNLSNESTTMAFYLFDPPDSTFVNDKSITSFNTTNVTATSVRLKWSQSTKPFTAGYYISYSRCLRSYSRTGFSISVTPTYRHLLGNNATTLEVTELQPGVTYTFSLWAFTEEKRDRRVMKKPLTTEARTLETAPTEPRNLTVMKVDSANVTFGWIPPVSPNGAVSYTLEYTLPSGVPVSTAPIDGVNTTVSFPEEYATYPVAVRAVNTVGKSESEPLSVCPGKNNPLVPEAPEYVFATNSDRGTIGLKWQPSIPRLCDGGVDHYTVQYNLVGGNTTSQNVTGTSILLRNLEAGATYEIVVYATNRIGSSKKSQKILVNTTTISVAVNPLTMEDIIIGTVAGSVILLGLCTMMIIIIISLVTKHRKKRGEVMYHLAKNDVNFTPLVETEDIGYRSVDTSMPSQAVHEPPSHSSFAVGNGHLQDHSNQFPLQPRGYSSPYINISKTRASKHAISSAIPVDEFTGHIQEMYSQGRQPFKTEYESIPKKLPLATSIAEANMNRNRYKNIFPYDNNRVILSTESSDGTNYINASFVDGYSRNNQYIAAQAPIPCTISDFWQMVWDQHAQMIIMLTKTVENTKVKCEQYFPLESGGSVSAERFEVRVNSLKHHVDYEVRRIELEQTSSKEILYVTHYLFTGWPDKGVPSYPTSLVHLLYRVKKERTSQDPIIVHCSAGVGRSGTFIALDCILDQINEENTVDIKGVVKKLREKRMLMVQTVEQYMFVYNAVRELLLCGNTSVRAVDLRRFLSTVDSSESVEISRQLNVVQLLTQESAEDRRVARYRDKIRYVDRAPWRGKHLYITSVNTAAVNIINASYVDGYHSPKAFIAAQSPMATTVDDFWSMIWENKSQVVVLLCQLVENEEESSYSFWPRSIGTSFYSDGLEVTLSEEKTSTRFCQYQLSIKHPRQPTPLGVTLLHYKHWAEWSKPSDTSALLQLIVNTQKLQQSCSDFPVVVTCNDGLGRSGTFIAIWSLIEQMKTEGQIDVLSTVKSIRTQRPGAVERLEYFTYCFEVIVDYIDSFEGYSNFEN